MELLENAFEEGCLVWEVVIEGPRGHPGGAGQVLHRRRGETSFAEQVPACPDEGGTGLGHLFGPQGRSLLWDEILHLFCVARPRP